MCCVTISPGLCLYHIFAAWGTLFTAALWRYTKANVAAESKYARRAQQQTEVRSDEVRAE